MKIIIANYRYFVAGGPEKYMFKFMDAAEKKGITAIPFSVTNPNNKPTPYSKYFAKPRASQLMYADTKFTLGNIYGMLRATLWNYEAGRKLRKLIRDTQPDAVYILHEINHLSPAIIHAAKREGIRVVHRISDFFMFCAKYDFLRGDEICEECLQGKYKKALRYKCVKNSWSGTMLRIMAMKLYQKTGVFQKVDHYITTCKFTRSKLIEGGILSGKISCIPTFINVKNIQPCYEHDKYFLFLGRMAHQKGTIYAIKAMRMLKDSEYLLKITGDITDSEENQKIWHYITDHNLQNKIIFTGFKHGEELETLIKHATCIVCPAIWYENMPNTVIEAYAYGKPVVASRIGSLAEIVDDGETGFLFEPKNDVELSSILRKFIVDETLSAFLGKKARQKCQQEYSEELHMERVISVLKGNHETE